MNLRNLVFCEGETRMQLVLASVQFTKERNLYWKINVFFNGLYDIRQLNFLLNQQRYFEAANGGFRKFDI